MAAYLPLRLSLTLSLMAGSISVAEGAEVLVVGDEWTHDGAAELQASFSAARLAPRIDNAAVPGATAEWVATTPAVVADLSDRLADNPDVRWVVVSLGANDLRRDYRTRGLTAIRDDNIKHLRSILEPLGTRFPNVRIVLFGLDWPNYVSSAACRTRGEALFGPLAGPLQVNDAYRRAVGDAYQRVAAELTHVDYVDLFGVLQAEAGASTDSTRPSPMELMFDCERPTAAGVRALTDALVAAYWGAPRPRAEAMFMPSPACVDQNVMITSASTAAIDNEWWIDGVLTSTQGTFMTKFERPGTYEVILRASNRAYRAEALASLPVEQCDAAGGGLADGGGTDGGTSDGGTGGAPDGSTDSGMDAASPDATTDAGIPDSGVDVGFPDSGVDVGVPDSGVDVGVDVGVPDSGVDVGVDVGFPDSGVDVGFPDSGVDVGFPDSGVDVGFPDSGVDVGFPDSGVDVGFPDSGVDVGFPDSGVDVGFPDSGVDVGFPDSGVDVGFPDSGVDVGFPDSGVDVGFPDSGVDVGFPDTGVDVGFPDTGVDVGVAAVDSGVPQFEEVGILGAGCSAGPHRSRSSGMPLTAIVLLAAAGLLRQKRKRS